MTMFTELYALATTATLSMVSVPMTSAGRSRSA